MMLRRTLLIVAASILIPIGGAFALTETQANRPLMVAQQTAQSDDFRSRGSRESRWLDELDLTTEQSEQIQAIREDSRATMEPLHQQLQQAREQLQSQLASDTPTDQLRRQHQQVQALQQQLGEQRFESMLAIRQVLTSEQRVQMAELAEQHRGQRGRGHRRGGE